MRILFLCYDLPYPLDAGGKIRAYHMIKQLSIEHDVHVRYFYRSEETKQYEKHLSGIAKSIKGFKRRPVLSPKNGLYLPALPFPAALYKDPIVERALETELKSKQFDVVHLESFYMSPYLKNKSPFVQILGTENIEWHIYKEYAKTRNKVFAFFMNLEVARIRAYEKNTWRLPDALFAVSQENKKEIMQETSKQVFLIKNGVDTDFIYPKRTQPHKAVNILFVGNFAYLQNKQAAETLVRDIAPALSSEFTIQLVGKNPTDLIVELAAGSSTISLDTEVDDIRTAYKNAHMLVAPIMLGSGTKFKVLEAMAAGLPVVTTPLGAEGIDMPRDTVSVGQDPKSIVSIITKLSLDSKTRHHMATRARKVIEKNYSWDAIGKTLRSAYNEVINNNRKL